MRDGKLETVREHARTAKPKIGSDGKEVDPEKLRKLRALRRAAYASSDEHEKIKATHGQGSREAKAAEKTMWERYHEHERYREELFGHPAIKRTVHAARKNPNYH